MIPGKNSAAKGEMFFVFSAVLAVFCFLAFFHAVEAGARQGQIPESFSELAEKSSPMVVNIRTVKTVKDGGRVFRHFQGNPFGGGDPFNEFFKKFFGEDEQREFRERSLGSGFIISRDGFIVTNNHVIEDAAEIRVKLKNGREYDGTIEGRDPNTDLALIKIKSDTDLPVAKWGNSDKLKVGQWVVAIGSPFGLEHTVTAGIVSAKGRVIGSGPYDDFIQTDASINPGNSGGPLLNMEGEVVGINTAIVATGQGIGFAVPVNLAEDIIEQLKKHGEVTRGWLGVAIQDLTGELAEYYGMEEKKGVLVTDVFEDDPADVAGIKPKDIILSVNGKAVESTRDLTRMIAAISVGDDASIAVLRNGKEKTFKVEIAKREDGRIFSKRTKKDKKDELGIQVSELTPELSERYNISDSEGVIVTDLDSKGKGAKAGIAIGDFIKEINHKSVKTVKDYYKAMDEIKPGSDILMFIKRMNAGFIVVKLTK